MEKETLDKLVRHEVDMLRYYTLKRSREKLTEDSDFYKDLTPMGYTKTCIPLLMRCPPGTVTSDEEIVEGMDIGLLRQDTLPRNLDKNKHTPLGAYLIVFPEKKKDIIERLNKINR